MLRLAETERIGACQCTRSCGRVSVFSDGHQGPVRADGRSLWKVSVGFLFCFVWLRIRRLRKSSAG